MIIGRKMFSNRINTLIEFSKDAINLADIGSDHGYLLIGLKEKYPSIKLLGVENKKGPFNSLNANINKFGLKDKILTSLSDGIDDVSEEYETIVLAGMGYNNIKKIILKNIEKLKNIDYFIIDSHTNVDLIRLFFNELGYTIIKEKMILEDNIFYTIIKFKKGKECLSEDEIRFGPLILKSKDQIFVKYIDNLIIKNESILSSKLDEKTKDKYQIELNI